MQQTAAPVTRRAAGRTLALGLAGTLGLAALLPLPGCGFPLPFGTGGTEEADSAASDTETAGQVNFDGLLVTLNMDNSTWQWSTLSNSTTSANGSIMVTIPVNLKNNGDGAKVLNSLTVTISAPDGTVLPDISGDVPDDLLANKGIGVGSETNTVMHVLYRGAGTYKLNFDNMLGTKATLPFDVSDARNLGIRALPSAITSFDAGNAVPSGASFDAEDLTLTLSADRNAYVWVQVDAPSNAAWNGVWCVGVPVTVANNTSEAQSVTLDAYVKFDPNLNRQQDPAAFFNDDITNIGSIAAGQTITCMIYFVYVIDGNYYLAMDNNGASVLATALIAQYY